ncbi:hypothetical protein BGZ60DRAFT_144733 [Tricladium varicosporioides]|nr:hypothetical protein BGZ60DRAFT_144733 [Hymenoscyphus varicosporioides]
MEMDAGEDQYVTHSVFTVRPFPITSHQTGLKIIIHPQSRRFTFFQNSSRMLNHNKHIRSSWGSLTSPSHSHSYSHNGPNLPTSFEAASRSGASLKPHRCQCRTVCQTSSEASTSWQPTDRFVEPYECQAFFPRFDLLVQSLHASPQRVHVLPSHMFLDRRQHARKKEHHN